MCAEYLATVSPGTWVQNVLFLYRKNKLGDDFWECLRGRKEARFAYYDNFLFFLPKNNACMAKERFAFPEDFFFVFDKKIIKKIIKIKLDDFWQKRGSAPNNEKTI